MSILFPAVESFNSPRTSWNFFSVTDKASCKLGQVSKEYINSINSMPEEMFTCRYSNSSKSFRYPFLIGKMWRTTGGGASGGVGRARAGHRHAGAFLDAFGFGKLVTCSSSTHTSHSGPHTHPRPSTLPYSSPDSVRSLSLSLWEIDTFYLFQTPQPGGEI